jgi:Fe-S-cluster containining protein
MLLMTGHSVKTGCDRCGTCCEKGGPALHYADGQLLWDKRLTPEALITIRKGEPVFSLSAENFAPAQSEIVKIKGQGMAWTCLFYRGKEAGCAIYGNRPLECSLLKCWETAALEKIAGRNLLSRYDIIVPDDPILPYIRSHENTCSLENLFHLISAVKEKRSCRQAIDELTGLANADLAIRSQVLARFHLSLDLELFFFGRPIFTILQEFGIDVDAAHGICSLSHASSPLSGT